MKPVWKGTLHFFQFTFPVKLYSATQTKSIQFNKFHKVCRSRISHEKSCPVHGLVPESEIMTAFPISENEYVPFESQEFEQISLSSQSQLELTEFIDFEDFDPLLIYKSYFLTPDGMLAKATYALLKQALTRSRKVALLNFTTGRKEYLAALWYRSPAIMLSLLYYRDELKKASEITELKKLPRTRKRQVDAIIAQIEQNTITMRHAKYQDGFFKQFFTMIQKRVKELPELIFAPNTHPKADLKRKGMSKFEKTENRSSSGTND